VFQSSFSENLAVYEIILKNAVEPEMYIACLVLVHKIFMPYMKGALKCPIYRYKGMVCFYSYVLVCLL